MAFVRILFVFAIQMCYLCLQKKYSPGQTDIEQNWAAPEVTLVQELFFSMSGYNKYFLSLSLIKA